MPILRSTAHERGAFRSDLSLGENLFAGPDAWSRETYNLEGRAMPWTSQTKEAVEIETANDKWTSTRYAQKGTDEQATHAAPEICSGGVDGMALLCSIT